MSSLPMVNGGGGELKRVVIGSANSAGGRSFDVKSVLPYVYSQLTLDNFAVLVTGMGTSAGSDWRSGNLLVSYDASTGALSTGRVANYTAQSSTRQIINYTVVCYYVE